MFATIPPVTRALLIANIAVFIAQSFADDALITLFALWPFGTPAYTGPEIPAVSNTADMSRSTGPVGSLHVSSQAELMAHRN